MKEILLNHGKVTTVDDEDFERLNQFKWWAHRDGNTWYAQRHSPMIDGKRKNILMHREILNIPNGIKGDHRNGNGLDNRKGNLRLSTSQQNAHNRKHPQKNNKLGIKGVCWRKDVRKFQAQIGFNGKVIYLGCFNVLGDADSAYRIAEEKYFGGYARKTELER